NKLPSGGGFVYRGQSDESWGLASTYYRRFNLNKSGDKQQPTQKQFQDYHETLIKDAKSYHYHKEKLSDLELLLELQHYGAATGLVDFSRDFLIALWFAAHDNKGKNGKVFVLNINDIDKFSELQKGEKKFDECEKLQFVNNNFKSNNRIFAQKGVFIFGNQTIDNAETIEISEGDKKLILQELSAIFSIDEKSLFQDIYGFSMVNDVNHSIYEKTAEEYLLEGNRDYQKNKFKEAIKAYEKVIEIEPNNNWAHYNMGLAYYGLGKFKEAIKAYEKVIEIEPNNNWAHHNIGFAYAQLNEFEKAIKAYKKAIEIKPDFDKAYYSMGLAYSKLSKFEKAIKALKKAIDLNPALINHSKQQNWHALETWINNLPDTDKKQQYLHTLKRLKDE
ncbi:hypothetical protein BSPLISOX_2021, partial [uncultured Gammaproteobacteria bacterium]